MPLLLAAGAWTAAFLATLAAWPARRLAPLPRFFALLIPLAVIFIAPHAAHDAPLGVRIALVLSVCAVLPPKLLDLAAGAADWRGRPFSHWLCFVLHPCVLVWRTHQKRKLEPGGLRLLARGLVEIGAGVALYLWAVQAELQPWALDHVVKLAVAYLCALDGFMITATALCWLAGSPVLQGSVHPVLAATPAEFWRRYNRSAGELFHEDVFLPLGGRHAPVLGILAVFLLNGVFHELLAFTLSRRVTGLQVAFFAVQAIAVAVTFRLRPKGAWRVVGIAATALFNIATSVMFFVSFETVTRWYRR